MKKKTDNNQAHQDELRGTLVDYDALRDIVGDDPAAIAWAEEMEREELEKIKRDHGKPGKP